MAGHPRSKWRLPSGKLTVCYSEWTMNSRDTCTIQCKKQHYNCTCKSPLWYVCSSCCPVDVCSAACSGWKHRAWVPFWLKRVRARIKFFGSAFLWASVICRNGSLWKASILHSFIWSSGAAFTLARACAWDQISGSSSVACEAVLRQCCSGRIDAEDAIIEGTSCFCVTGH